LGSKGHVGRPFGTLWNALEADLSLQEVEGALDSFAQAGAGYWRIRPANVTLLQGLPGVRAGLAFQQTDDPDVLPDEIESAVLDAIKTMQHPHREAGLEHFGFTPEGRRLKSKTAREDRAAECLGRSGRWYRQTNKRDYAGLAPRAWMIAQVAQRLIHSQTDPSTAGASTAVAPAVIAALGKSWRVLNHHLHSQPPDGSALPDDVRQAIRDLGRPIEYILQVATTTDHRKRRPR
jgi:hypothetical protein